jgi:hypothetical protein
MVKIIIIIVNIICVIAIFPIFYFVDYISIHKKIPATRENIIIIILYIFLFFFSIIWLSYRLTRSSTYKNFSGTYIETDDKVSFNKSTMLIIIIIGAILFLSMFRIIKFIVWSI